MVWLTRWVERWVGDWLADRVPRGGDSDEPAHLVLLYTPLFSPFFHFLPIADPLPHTLPTWPPVHNACLHLTLYQSLHQTGSPYLMDRWLIDLIATFMFLNYLMRLITTWLITSHHTAQSGTYCSFISDEPCAWFLVYHLNLTHLYLLCHPDKNTERVFPLEFRLGKFHQYLEILNTPGSHCQDPTLPFNPQSNVRWLMAVLWTCYEILELNIWYAWKIPSSIQMTILVHLTNGL